VTSVPVTLPKPFPDVELIFMDLLRGLAKTVTALPSTITVPLYRVERVGGIDDGVTDRPRVLVEAWGADRQKSWKLTRDAQALILAAGGQMVTGPQTVAEYPGGVLLDLTRTASAPKQVPEAGRDPRVTQAAYEVHLRRPWW
jgi:hypothetical protein